ncbi:alpha/beta fold hydrolase [Streptomyces viridosporus]|uniref:alpha/beta fold hydrolase n=1 Tax=Streptomyces viridosporus TaxID=67581 RepID=UPI00332866DB
MPRVLPSAWRTGAAALALSAAVIPGPAASAPFGGNTAGERPTIVLVHGSFTDASGWQPVIGALQQRGYRVVAPANPLRGLSKDSAYLAAFLKSIDGPIVLVGHSYGGAVITNAATGNPHVTSLVYIAGFAPKKGETTAELLAKFPGSRLTDAFNAVPIPKDQGAVDLYVKPDKFRDVFLSNRLSPAEAAVAAASQRPATPATSTDKSGAPAWKTIPSWFLVGTDDRAIGTANLRFMADRARARTVEVDAPHAAYLTAPDAVTDLILDAAGTPSPAHTPSLAHTGSSTTAALSGAAAATVALGTALLWSARKRRQSNRA